MDAVATSRWVACPRCGHEGYHDHQPDTGKIPGSNGRMVQIPALDRVYPNHSYRCILCQHKWWTEVTYVQCGTCFCEKVLGEPCGLPCV